MWRVSRLGRYLCMRKLLESSLPEGDSSRPLEWHREEFGSRLEGGTHQSHPLPQDDTAGIWAVWRQQQQQWPSYRGGGKWQPFPWRSRKQKHWVTVWLSQCNCSQRSLFLSSDTLISEEGPPSLERRRREERKQIWISEGLKRMLPAVCLRTSAGNCPEASGITSIKDCSTRPLGNPKPWVLNPHTYPHPVASSLCVLPSVAVRASQVIWVLP